MSASNKRIAGYAATIGSYTAISRVAGLIRDQLTAYFFGASMFSDAFYVAFRIPNLLRNFLAEGAMTTSFVPVFTDHLVNKGKDESKKLSDSMFTLMSFLVIAVTAIGILGAPFIVKLIASGYHGEKFDLTVKLTRIMFPYIALVSLMAVAMGVLNSLKIFMPPAASPIIFNIFWISSFFGLYYIFDLSIYALAIGVLIGGVFQLFFQFPYLKKQGFSFSFNPDFHNPAIIKIGKLLLPAMFGSAVYQINIIVNTHLASLIPGEANTYLYYSNRLTQLPVGLIIVAFGTAILPTLSEEFAKKNIEEMKAVINHALRLVLFLTIPATFGIIALRIPIISTLFQHGEFSWEATQKTAFALIFDASGLFAIAGVKIFSTAFFSLKDTKTPFYTAFMAMFVNLFCALIFSTNDYLSFGGLSLAVSCAATFNLVILAISLRKVLGSMGMRHVLKTSVKILIASGVMALIAHFITAGDLWAKNGMIIQKIFWLGLGITGGLAAFFFITWIFRMEELQTVKEMLTGKLRRKVTSDP
jgi:putative peptidoglycan lipid II flippase